MDLTPSRRWGQNFLVSEAEAQAEAALVDLPPESSVVEIGGGLGILSKALLDRGFRPLSIVEIDPKLASLLEHNLKQRATLIRGDALTVPLPPAQAYVGNLPFSVAVPLLLRLLEVGIEHGVFLVQREVAERLAAEPGGRDFGPLTVRGRLEGEFRIARIVPRAVFFPSPKVDGAVVVYRRSPIEPAPLDAALTMQLVHRVFNWRRKQLQRTLPSVLEEWGFAPESLSQILEEAQIPSGWEQMRPEELTPETWVRMANGFVRMRPRRTKSGPRVGQA